jgi:hypothetical protein
MVRMGSPVRFRRGLHHNTTGQVEYETDVSCDEDPATAFAREFASPTCTL